LAAGGAAAAGQGPRRRARGRPGARLGGMIAFGCVILDPEAHRRYAGPGIRAVREPDSALLAFDAVAPDARAWNLVLDAAAGLDDLEALVLVDSRAELTDPGFCARARAALADPDVAVAGCAGAAGGSALAWWTGEVHAAPVVHRYHEHGGGDLPAYAWADPRPAPAEVDAVDGLVMVLSPWAVRELRFDDALWHGLGWDVDFCRQVRAAGRKVVVADLRVTDHRSIDRFPDHDRLVAAHLQLAEKWEPADGVDWEARARRAEAEREAARIQSYFNTLVTEARVQRLQAELDAAVATPGWRLTAPLRHLNHLRRRRRERRV